MRTYADLQAEAARLGPLVPAAAPTTASIGVGWSIYEKAPADADYWPRGGVVVHVVPRAVLDEDSGELLDRYVVVRADHGTLHFVSLRADQVAAVDDGNRPNAHTIAGVCQVATREAAEQLGKRRATPEYERLLDLFSLGARLMAVLVRPGTVAP